MQGGKFGPKLTLIECPVPLERRKLSFCCFRVKYHLKIMQGLRSLWSPPLMTLALLCDNKRPSAVCQQKFRIALTLNYLYGLNSFKLPGAYLISDLPEGGRLIREGGLFTKSKDKDISGNFSVLLSHILRHQRHQHTILRLKYINSTQFLFQTGY